MASSQLQKLETYVHCQASADQFFDLFCNKTHYIAKIMPNKVQSIDLQEGEWGTEGSIISWKFSYEGKNCVAKEVIESIDRENKKISYKVIGGDLLQNYKSFKFIMQSRPKEKGGVTSLVMEYEKQNDDTPHPHTMKQFANEVINKADAYLTKDHN